MSQWLNLTQDEQDEFIALIRKIEAWTTYCAQCRDKKTRRPIDYSFDLRRREYLRWDELSTTFWK